jgi:hypothetical protein
MFQLPRFRNVRRFAEPEDEYYDEAEHNPEEKVDKEEEEEGEEWTLVDNFKYRKPKPELDFSDDELGNYGEPNEDGTVWGAPEEHETCWDDRR